MIYVALSEGDFVNGWSSTKIEDSIVVKHDKLTEDIKNNFQKYRYDRENNEFVLDESKQFRDSKQLLMEELHQKLLKKNEDGFLVTLDGEKLRYKNTDANKGFLQKAYTMKESGLIDSTTLKFIDKDGNEATRLVKGNNIFELWILSFLHEDDLNKHFNENLLPLLEKAETIEDLGKITWLSQV